MARRRQGVEPGSVEVRRPAVRGQEAAPEKHDDQDFRLVVGMGPQYEKSPAVTSALRLWPLRKTKINIPQDPCSVKGFPLRPAERRRWAPHPPEAP